MDGELGAAKELGQIVAAKETNENVPFAEIGVREADGGDKKCGNVEGNHHAHLTPGTRAGK